MRELTLGSNLSLNITKLKEFFVEDLDSSVTLLVKRLIEEALRCEQEEYLEAAPYSHSYGRRDYRNGSYLRSLRSHLGMIYEVEVPRCRKKGFRSHVLWYIKQLHNRVDKSIMKMFLTGTSTRKVGEVMQSMLGFKVSSSYVSGVCKDLDKEVNKYHKRSLQDRYRYLFLDGIYLKNKEALGSRKRAILVAYGITQEGQRELIDFQVAQSESQVQWQGFLERLKLRGVTGEVLKLVVVDGGKGLINAIEWVWPDVLLQRCWVHKLRNVSNYLPKRIQQECLNGARDIYTASNKTSAVIAFKRWKIKWQKRVPKAVACIEKDLDYLLHFYQFPKHHWIKIRTTNVIERCFREVRRRTHSMGVFPNIESTQRLVYSLFTYFNNKWKGKGNYISMITNNLKQAA